MSRPLILDLFCGAGGAGTGYHRAGFDVVGVDIAPQPNYPFEFHQADALDYLLSNFTRFDAVHASPPCQASSALTKGTNQGKDYPQLIPATRALLNEVTGFLAMQPPHPPHRGRVAGLRHGKWYEGPYFAVYGNGGGKGSLRQWQEAMGTPWMQTKAEIAEAIPPAFTEYIGEQLLAVIEAAA